MADFAILSKIGVEVTPSNKGKPAERRRRKATGLQLLAWGATVAGSLERTGTENCLLPAGAGSSVLSQA